MAQSANVVAFALGSGAFLCFVELFRSLRVAVRFICHRRTRPGWGRSPPRPQHPRLPLSPSPLRDPLGLPRPASGAGEIRLPAFLALKPHPCGLPRPPAHASARAMGSNTLAVLSGFLMRQKCRYAYGKYIQRKRHSEKDQCEVKGVISQKQKSLCKT